MSKPGARRKRTAGGVRRQRGAAIAVRQAAQRRRAVEKKAWEKAQRARNKFRPRKADRGQMVMVGVDGKRDPQARGRKGYFVHVTRTGRKMLVHNTDDPGAPRPRKLSDFSPPIRRNLRRVVDNFQARRLVLLSTGRAVRKGRGRAENARNVSYDFGERMVNQMAESLARVFAGQVSQRSFQLTALVLVELPDGGVESLEVIVQIDKPDHIAIKLAGLVNFIRMKFYAFMATALHFKGYVSMGSSNHVRKLPENQGRPRSQWTNGRGDRWQGNDDVTVRILAIEWKIEQAT